MKKHKARHAPLDPRTMQPSHPAHAQTALRKRLALGAAAALALLLLVAAYSNHFDNGFHFDDFHVIVHNIYIRSLGNIPQFFRDAMTFTSLPENATYRPLLSVTFALDYALGDGVNSARQFHYTQFACLLLLGVSLFFLYRKLAGYGAPTEYNDFFALFGAFFFCVHTANTQTVNYISSRSSLIATLGAVAALNAYLYFPKLRKFVLYGIPMLLGCLAKPITIMFAPMLLLWIYLCEEDRSLGDLGTKQGWRALGRATLRSLPALLLGLGLYLFLTKMDADTVVLSQIKPLDYFMTQPFVWVHYLRLFLLPVGLTADTDWRVLAHWYDTRLFVGACFIALLLWAAFRTSRSRALRPISFGLLWIPLALAPDSSIIPLSEVYNEHRIFFPYVGATFVLIALAQSWVQHTRASHPARLRFVYPALLAAASALAIGHTVGTHARNQVWLSEETLWLDVTLKSPENGRALMNYGLSQMNRGNFARALEYYDRARIHTPNYAYLDTNTAIAKAAIGKHTEAEFYFRRALQLSPNFAAGHLFYARWLADQKRVGDAMHHLQRTLEISPSTFEARTSLMQIYAALGETEALRTLAQETLRLAPTDAATQAYASGGIPFAAREETVTAYEMLGRGYLDQKQFLVAATIYRHAIRLDAKSASAWNNLGWALLNLGSYEASIASFARALELDPKLDIARNNLNWAKQELAAQQAKP